MKRIYFLLATILFFHTVTAQNKIRKAANKHFFTGIHFSPDLCYRQLVNNDGQSVTETIIKARNRIEKTRVGLSTGISFGWYISSRVQVETGLFFSDRGYRTNKELLVYIPPVPGNAPFAVKHIYKKRFFDVPLRVVYLWGDKRLQLATGGGLIMNLLLNQRQVTYNYFETGEMKKENTKLQDDFKRLNLSLQLGMGLRYRINERLRLMVEPVVKYGLFKSADTPVAEKLWTVGLNSGIYFSIKK